MAKYHLVSKGLHTRRLIPTDVDVYEVIKDYDSDFYMSPFIFNEDHKQRFDETGSIAGIRDTKTNRLYWDFDSKQDVTKAKADAEQMVERLKAHGISDDSIFCAFSGQKGFDVTIVTDKEFSPTEVKTICTEMAKGLPTFDKSIYDAVRLYRLTGTKHQATGLYKTQLDVSDLKKDITTIQNMAKERREVNSVYITQIPNEILEIKPKDEPKKEVTLGELNTKEKPDWMHAAKWALQQGLYEAGEGNVARMILAATYKSQGFDRDMALAMIEVAEAKRAERLKIDVTPTSQIVTQIINPVFADTWTGGTYAVKNTPLLQEMMTRYNIQEEVTDSKDINYTVSISDMRNKFEHFAKNIDKNRIKTGFETLDDNLTLLSGMMVSIVGAPSSGKTLTIDLIVKNQKQYGNAVFFGSYDMYDMLLYARSVQHYCGYDVTKIANIIRSGTIDKKLMEAMERVERDNSHIAYNYRTAPTVEQLEQDIIAQQQNSGEKIRLVVVDYFEKIQGPYAGETLANATHVAQSLANLARKHDLCLFNLVQPQKTAGDPSQEITSMRAIKGSSVIEQDSRVVMSISRPGFDVNDPRNDRFITYTVVKNNMGKVGRYDFLFDGSHGIVEEMTARDKIELMELRQRNQEKALNKVKNTGWGF